MRRKDQQLEFDFVQHGGKRKGAGRKPKNDEAGMPHRQRPAKKRGDPLHITVRLADGLPSLRRGGALKVVLAALSASSNRHGMRIVHYTIQRDHLHLLVEADDRECVARGMNALQSPLARALNKLWGRSGKVFPDRYHDEVISTPTQARNALRYVLQNGKKHGVVASSSIDLCSSAPVFDGWKESASIPSNASIIAAPLVAAVAPASTWLLTTGWRRHGLLGIDELPRSAHTDRPEQTSPNQDADTGAEVDRPAAARATNQCLSTWFSHRRPFAPANMSCEAPRSRGLRNGARCLSTKRSRARRRSKRGRRRAALRVSRSRRTRVEPRTPSTSFARVGRGACYAVAPASTWRLTIGWRRHGLLGIDKLPRSTHAERLGGIPGQSSREHGR